MPRFALASHKVVHTRTAETPKDKPSKFAWFAQSKVCFPLLAIVAALLIYGLITVRSVTLVDADYSFSRQLFGVVIGIGVMALFWKFDYRKFGEWFVPLLVIDIVLILLPLVPGLGIEANGATSWIKVGSFTFQPSEIAKPVTIVVMASATARYGGTIVSASDFFRLFALILIPFVLLATEDLGSALVILISGFVIMFVGGLDRKWIVLTLVCGVLGVAVLLGANSVVNTFTGGSVQLIKPYQMSRLLVFVDQDNPDYADDAYNLNQAKIAVGSGEVVGKGYGNATQSSGGFLPEAATDFIFCVVAEQFGFVGSFVLIGLYLALLLVALSIGLRAGDLFGSLIVSGVMGMWLFQIVENIGMDLGLMPITGIPLPFMSYGSSFMIMNFICIGMLMSIWMRKGDNPVNTNDIQN